MVSVRIDSVGGRCKASQHEASHRNEVHSLRVKAQDEGFNNSQDIGGFHREATS